MSGPDGRKLIRRLSAAGEHVASAVTDVEGRMAGVEEATRRLADSRSAYRDSWRELRQVVVEARGQGLAFAEMQEIAGFNRDFLWRMVHRRTAPQWRGGHLPHRDR